MKFIPSGFIWESLWTFLMSEWTLNWLQPSLTRDQKGLSSTTQFFNPCRRAHKIHVIIGPVLDSSKQSKVMATSWIFFSHLLIVQVTWVTDNIFQHAIGKRVALESILGSERDIQSHPQLICNYNVIWAAFLCLKEERWPQMALSHQLKATEPLYKIITSEKDLWL